MPAIHFVADFCAGIFQISPGRIQICDCRILPLQLPLFHIRVYTAQNRVLFFANESEVRPVFDDIEGNSSDTWQN